jgi:NitT/TauT family transport system substrate-binding protein
MRRIFALTIFILVIIVIAACGRSDELSEVRIGFFPNITHAQALYGKHTGLFDDAFGDETDIRWLQFNAGPAVIEAMFAGEVDISYIGPIPAINAYLRSRGDVRVVSGAADGGAVLVTRPDLVLYSAAGLDGLRVAIPQLANTQHISLLHILRENGLETSDRGGTVDVIQATNADIRMLLSRGEVDAALVPEPWGAIMIQETGANLFLDEKQVWRDGNYPVALVIVHMDFLNAHPEKVRAFLQTHLHITDLINADRLTAGEVINKELEALTGRPLESGVLEEAFGRIKVTADIDIEVLNEFIVLLAEEGFAVSADPQPGLIYRFDALSEGD